MKKNNLRHTLSEWGSVLLQKDIENILKIAYDVRSEIVHTGDISNNIIKKNAKYN